MEPGRWTLAGDKEEILLASLSWSLPRPSSVTASTILYLKINLHLRIRSIPFLPFSSLQTLRNPKKHLSMKCLLLRCSLPKSCGMWLTTNMQKKNTWSTVVEVISLLLHVVVAGNWGLVHWFNLALFIRDNWMVQIIVSLWCAKLYF